MRLLLLFFSLPLFAGAITYTYHEDQRAHVLDVDPILCTITPAKAIDNGIGRESVLSLAQRHAATAGVNGGFFSMRGTLDGRAAGALKIGEWIALPIKPRGCIGWSAGSPPIFDRLLVQIDSSLGPIDGFNRERGADEMVLFSPLFNRTTLTLPDGEELVIRNGVVVAMNRGGSSPIPGDGHILSIGPDHPLFETLDVGAPVAFAFTLLPQTSNTTARDWEVCDFVVGGTPLLLHNGTKITDFAPEQTRQTFLTDRHARTAIGWKPDGHWLFVVVDGDGLTMDQLVALMAHFGCTEALNLDGGGSSTMIYNSEVVNDPRGDEDEGQDELVVRRVSDAILVVDTQPRARKKTA